jgi:ABC-type sugar transport system permease subunit
VTRLLTIIPYGIMGITLLLVLWRLATEFALVVNVETVTLALPFLVRSVVFATLTAAAQTLVGLAAALTVLWLARRRITQLALITIFLLPYAVPASVIGLVFRFVVGTGSAWATTMSPLVGVPPEYWLYSHPLRAAGLATIWQFSPFAFLLSFLAIRAIPQGELRSAQMDGAPFWKLLESVVLARIWPVLASIFALRLVFMLVKFDTPYVFTEMIASADDVATVELWRVFKGSGSPELPIIAWALQLTVIGLATGYVFAQRRRSR